MTAHLHTILSFDGHESWAMAHGLRQHCDCSQVIDSGYSQRTVQYCDCIHEASLRGFGPKLSAYQSDDNIMCNFLSTPGFYAGAFRFPRCFSTYQF